MQNLLNELYGLYPEPVVSAILLGLMIAISPCTLASNITALGYASKDINNRRVIFYNGLLYTLGRIFGFTLLIVIIWLGADAVRLSLFFELYGEKFLSITLIIIGVILLDIVPLSFIVNFSTPKFLRKARLLHFDLFLMGILFAIGFCPFSGVLFFGMVVPLAVVGAKGLLIPVVFAVATSLPVLLFAWLIAFTAAGIGKWFNAVTKIEFWLRKIVALIFIFYGVVLVFKIWF